MMTHWDGYGWGMGLGWIFMIFFWIVVIAGTVFVVRAVISYGEKKGGETKYPETPLDILKKRYANREISRDEYEQIKKDIS